MMTNRNGRTLGWIGQLTPTQFLVLGYVTVILAGTALLALPMMSSDGRGLRLIDALFTATSAVCVTGLIVVNTARDLSIAGQVVVLVLIQIGALGIMTMSTFFAMLVGRRITLRDRLFIQEDLNQNYLSGLVRLVRHVLAVTFVIEGVGALLLFLLWVGEYGATRSLYYAVFHSISAFGNAGFDVFGNSFEGFASNVPINLIIAGLFIIGGLGFAVIAEVSNYPSKRRVSVHTQLVLRLTAGLILLGTIVILVLEWGNPDTLGQLGLKGKILAAFFHAVTPRTAGFNTLPTGQLGTATLFFTILLMYIGASPGSTGGGIKTSTFGVLVSRVVSTAVGRDDVVVFRRRIPDRVVANALSIVFLSGAWIILVTIVLLVSEGLELLPTLFEVVSAFGTVGLSTGITRSLSIIGKLMIILTMFIGRVGPMTLALAIGRRKGRNHNYRYPEDKIIVG